MADLQITSSCSSSTGFALLYPLAGITGNRTHFFNEMHLKRYGPSLLHIGLTSCYLIFLSTIDSNSLLQSSLISIPFISPTLCSHVVVDLCQWSGVFLLLPSTETQNGSDAAPGLSGSDSASLDQDLLQAQTTAGYSEFLGSLFPDCLKADYLAHLHKDCSNVKLLSLTVSVDICNADKHESKCLPLTAHRACVTAFLMMSWFIFVVSCWWSRWSCRYCTFGPSSTKTPSWPSGSEHSSR